MALTDANEWAKTVIIDSMVNYIPETPNHAEKLLERL
jgi:hypothetical protein